MVNLSCIVIGGFFDREYLLSKEAVYISVYLPSIGTFLLVIQIVYWSALLENFSFYVTLLKQSVKDIMTFMMLLMVFLIAFASGTIVIENNY